MKFNYFNYLSICNSADYEISMACRYTAGTNGKISNASNDFPQLWEISLLRSGSYNSSGVICFTSNYYQILISILLATYFSLWLSYIFKKSYKKCFSLHYSNGYIISWYIIICKEGLKLNQNLNV